VTAFILAAIVAGAQYLIWQHGSKGEPFVGTREALHGYAYSSYRRDQAPWEDDRPDADEIAGDLALLAHSAGHIRTYGNADTLAIAGQAEKYRLAVTAGAWLGGDETADRREIDTLMRLLPRFKNIDSLVIGNETLLRKDLSKRQLRAHLARARQAAGKYRIPVSTAEPWDVWLNHPDLAGEVDFVVAHILPYHEGIPIESAIDYAFMRYRQLVEAFPGKKIVIGEIGWPTRGPLRASIGQQHTTWAEASVENAARFVRGFLADPRSADIDYFLMEAFDQPWKLKVEGWAGAYWGIFNADRQAKFPFDGLVYTDIRWQQKAMTAAMLAFLPMWLLAFLLYDWSVFGRLWLLTLLQACAATLVIGGNVPMDYYLTERDLVGLALLISATMLTVAVLLSHSFEFGEIMFKRRWQRRFMPLPPHAADEQPFVSIHLACCNEPPEMVIATLDSLAALDYRNFEVLVVDNNTADRRLWEPLARRCRELGPRFRFFHLEKWPGFKAGALNFALRHSDPRSEVIGVVDADYVVAPQWLSCLLPHFDAPDVAVVQAPQAHRDWENRFFSRMCNWEFDGFFRIGMHHRNERNALIQHGTMTLVRRLALEEVGGWSQWCICEDTELGLRLLENGYDNRYVDDILGRGLTPCDFAAIKTQRYRWAFGAMQIFKAHLSAMLGKSRLSPGQRYHFLTGWFSWFGDALQLVFAFASILWTLGLLLMPHAFGLPVAALAVPVLVIMLFKGALGPVLYRRTMKAPWLDILGASILSVGLAHAIARGIFAGLLRRRGKFVRTPKAWKARGSLAFFRPLREELLMLATLSGGAVALGIIRGVNDFEARLWITILALQCLPYLASVFCQIAAHLPERRAADETTDSGGRTLALDKAKLKTAQSA